MTAPMKHVRASALDIAYEESGAADGVPVFLLHGWPYDPRCYDNVMPPLAAASCRVIVPYLRGFGPTRFLSTDTPRSGQQAALGNDLRELMDALAIERAVLAGYDWGGSAACIVAALWPERVRGLVTGNGYNLQNIPASVKPARSSLRTPAVVPVLFSQRTGPRRARNQSPRARPLALDTLVAAVDFRRRDFRAQRCVLRQSRFRHGDDPVVPSSLRLCGGRSGVGRDRGAACRAAQDRRADDCSPRRGRRRPTAGVFGQAWRFF